MSQSIKIKIFIISFVLFKHRILKWHDKPIIRSSSSIKHLDIPKFSILFLLANPFQILWALLDYSTLNARLLRSSTSFQLNVIMHLKNFITPFLSTIHLTCCYFSWCFSIALMQQFKNEFSFATYTTSFSPYVYSIITYFNL